MAKAVLPGGTGAGRTALVPASSRAPSMKLALASYGACVALSLALGVKVGLGVSSVAAALWTALALLGGWLGADFVGAVYHWNMDNYANGPNGFLAHHREPAALARRSLRMNVRSSAVPIAALLAGALTLPGGPLAAFLLTLLNGLLHTEHSHSLSHARAADLSRGVRLMQNVPGLPILISPAAHRRHHESPVGKQAYGGLNGWSNAIAEATHFFRVLEAVRERLTGRAPAWRNDAARR